MADAEDVLVSPTSADGGTPDDLFDEPATSDGADASGTPSDTGPEDVSSPDDIADVIDNSGPENNMQDDLAAPLPNSETEGLTDLPPDMSDVPSRAAIDAVREKYQLTGYEMNGYIDELRPKLLARGLTNAQIDDYYGIEKVDWSKLAAILQPDADSETLDGLTPSFWVDLQNKFLSSTTGMALFGRPPQDLPDEDASLPQQVATDMLSSLPDFLEQYGLYKGASKAGSMFIKGAEPPVEAGAAALSGAVMATARRVLIYLTDTGYCEDSNAAQKLMHEIAHDAGLGAWQGLSGYTGYELSGRALGRLGAKFGGDLAPAAATTLKTAKAALQGAAGAVALAFSQGQWPSEKETLEGALYGAGYARLEEQGGQEDEEAAPGTGGADFPACKTVGRLYRNFKSAFHDYGIGPADLVREGIKDPSLFKELASSEKPDLSPWFPEETSSTGLEDDFGKNAAETDAPASVDDKLTDGIVNSATTGHTSESPSVRADADSRSSSRSNVLPQAQREHILSRHAADATENGSKFPASWSAVQIAQAVQEVANSSRSTVEAADGKRTKITGTSNGIRIRVIIGRDGYTIVTAYPLY